MGDLVNEYQSGVNDYYSGHVPAHLDNPIIRVRSAYLQGWYQASMVDNIPEWILTEDETESMDFDELMEKW